MSAKMFEVELKREWAEKQGDIGIMVARVAGEALRRVVEKSPVGNPTLWKRPAPAGYVGGRFRGNWLLSVGAPQAGVVETVDAGGGATVERGLAAMPGYGADGLYPSVFIQNNLPYAEALENGHSAQAPGGVVALTVAEISAIFDGAKV
jgi:hypothetical protein